MKIVSIVGARPQFIKAATVSRIIKTRPEINEILVHTGQHYDEKMSSVFFDELDIPHPAYNLEVGSASHAVQTGMMLQGIETILLKEKPDWTLVYGDTNSTIAGALAATKLHIPLAHVEAGLRSFNKRMPEEINRIVTDRISDLLFAPTETAIKNLTVEGLLSQTRFTGDVMYDSVLFYRKKIEEQESLYKTPGLPDHYFLATIHRAENTDSLENLTNIFNALGDTNHPVVLPIHPRTAKFIQGKISVSPNIKIIEPVGYLHMLKLIIDSFKVITDSGGLQKEAYFLAKPCITVRTETEWVETLHDGWNIVTGPVPSLIAQAFEQPLPSSERNHAFGNGNAAGITIDFLLNQ